MTRILLTLVLVFAAFGCGRDDGDIDEQIGADCSTDGDCDNRCYSNPDDYPGGFCSSQCTSDDQCTPDAFCIARDGGICLFQCPEFDCARLGPGWACKDRDRIGGGSISVCFGD